MVIHRKIVEVAIEKVTINDRTFKRPKLNLSSKLSGIDYTPLEWKANTVIVEIFAYNGVTASQLNSYIDNHDAKIIKQKNILSHNKSPNKVVIRKDKDSNIIEEG